MATIELPKTCRCGGALRRGDTVGDWGESIRQLVCDRCDYELDIDQWYNDTRRKLAMMKFLEADISRLTTAQKAEKLYQIAQDNYRWYDPDAQRITQKIAEATPTIFSEKDFAVAYAAHKNGIYHDGKDIPAPSKDIL